MASPLNAALFQWLRRFNGYAVSMATPFNADAVSMATPFNADAVSMADAVYMADAV